MQRILEQGEALKKQQVSLRLCWVPGHADNAGNEAADQLAKRAVSAREDHNLHSNLEILRAGINIGKRMPKVELEKALT